MKVMFVKPQGTDSKSYRRIDKGYRPFLWKETHKAIKHRQQGRFIHNQRHANASKTELYIHNTGEKLRSPVMPSVGKLQVPTRGHIDLFSGTIWKDRCKWGVHIHIPWPSNSDPVYKSQRQSSDTPNGRQGCSPQCYVGGRELEAFWERENVKCSAHAPYSSWKWKTRCSHSITDGP